MRSTIPPYVDGWLGSERELTVIPQPEFPFSKNPTPDTYSRAYRRQYQVLPQLFLPKSANRTSWTNLLTYSEQIDNAAWTKANAAVLTGQGTAPDGQATLDALFETTANAEHSIAQGATAAAVASELSVFAVAGLTRSWIRLAFTDSAAAVFSGFFNVASGYVGALSAGVTAKIVGLGHGQFRCVLRFTPAAGAGTVKVNLSTDGSTISYVGTATAGAYLWGAQLGSGFDAPYIATSASGATISAPDRDKVDPFAYLCEEEDPIIGTSRSAVAKRLFARIPLPQTVPGSIQVTKPTIPGVFPQTYGSFRVVQPDATKASYDIYLPQSVLADSGLPAAVTGGTYTLTFGANTTASINFNDTNATVQTRLNALTSITNIGGVTVAGTYLTGFTVTFNNLAAATASGTSLTGNANGTNSSSVTSLNGGFTQYVTLTRLAATIAAAIVNAGSITNPAGTTASATIVPDYNGRNQSVNITSAGLDNGNPSIAISFTQTGGRFGIQSGAHFSFGVGDASAGDYIGKTYTLTIFGQTTAAINFNSTAATVLSAITAALTNLTSRGSIANLTANFAVGTGAPFPAGLGAFGNNFYIDFDLVPGGITGGTYTVSVLGQTTAAIAYNASISAIQTAINLLSNVTSNGGVVVTGAGYASGTISFSFGFPAVVLSGGTYTITLFTQTTAAIAYNAPAADVQAALNLLANVAAHGGVVVTGGWDGGFSIGLVINFLAANLTGAAGSLTPSPCAINVTASEPATGRIQAIVISTLNTDRFLTIPAHGFVAADTLVFNFGGIYYYGSPWTYVSVDQIKVNATVSPFNTGTLMTQVGKRTKTGYKPGLKLVRCLRVATSYLVGVTPGIATINDIPTPDFEGDPATLLAAIFAGETAINYQVGDLTSWHGPILTRTVTTLNAADL